MKNEPANPLTALLGTLVYLLLLLPLFLIWIPHKILASPETIYRFPIVNLRYFGLIPMVCGVFIYLWCSRDFVIIAKGTPIPFTPTRKLIVTGLYRYVRNPLYLAGILVLTGESIVFQSMGILIYLLLMAGLFHVHTLIEESLLAEQYGLTYERYKRHVPRWVPLLKPYRGDDAGSETHTC